MVALKAVPAAVVSSPGTLSTWGPGRRAHRRHTVGGQTTAHLVDLGGSRVEGCQWSPWRGRGRHCGGFLRGEDYGL